MKIGIFIKATIFLMSFYLSSISNLSFEIINSEQIRYNPSLCFFSQHFYDFKITNKLICYEWICDSNGLGFDSKTVVLKAKKTKKGWMFQPKLLKRNNTGKELKKFYARGGSSAPLKLPYSIEKDSEVGRIKVSFSVDEHANEPAMIHFSIAVNSEINLKEEWEGNRDICLYDVQIISLSNSKYPEVVVMYQDYRLSIIKIYSVELDKSFMKLVDEINTFFDKANEYYQEGQSHCWTECDALKYLLQIWDKIKIKEKKM